jgi:predicted ribosome quality control (RQC) complex YloA/Tae2 family protein
MNEQTIAEIVAELRRALVGRAWGKLFLLSRASLAADFRPGAGGYLFVSVEPNQPRLHLIKRTVRELEKASLPPTHFALTLRKALGGATLTSVTKDEADRVVRFRFEATDELGREHTRTLVAQLTGRAANLFLLDAEGRVLDRMRPSKGAGQEVGEPYEPPTRPPTSEQESPTSRPLIKPPFDRGAFASWSEAADDFYLRAGRERAFDSRASAAMSKLKQEITKRRKLSSNLARDLAAHGDAEAHKRAGDLLLANLATAERSGSVVRLTDFYADDTPTVELEVEEHRTLQEEAARRFTLYAKARRAAQEIAGRIETTEQELAALEERRGALEQIINSRDDDALDSFTAAKGRGDKSGARREGETAKASKQAATSVPGVRRYRSTDGYEILVGRGARDNDHLTFRVARSQDTWLHAADYPGSHVVVRNHRRDADVPHRTVIEAAQLAAHFSQARKDSKVAVNYTQRKFVSKPKASAPGLVRLSSFRTLLVEPREDLERL